MKKTKKNISQLNGAECIAEDSDLGISIWINKDLILMLFKGVVFPLTVDQFKNYSEVISRTSIYLFSEAFYDKKNEN